MCPIRCNHFRIVANRSAEPSEFYIVSEGIQVCHSRLARSVLEVKPDEDGVVVRYIRSGPASASCGSASSIIPTATRLTDTPLRDLTRRLNLCTVTYVDRAVRAHPSVAKRGADTNGIRLPGDWEGDMARLNRWQILWSLGKTIGMRAFGPFPALDTIPKEMDVRLLPAGEAVLAELKFGKFDAGLREGSFRSDVAAMRPVGPEVIVELVNQENPSIQPYLEHKYPPLARQLALPESWNW